MAEAGTAIRPLPVFLRGKKFEEYSYMKLLHLSDLHIGKRVNGFSMLPDQEYILKQVVSIAEREQPEAVLIAGDVYDKPQPPAEAVLLLDEFLTRLTALVPSVFLISGNHDSPERLDFGSRILREKGLYIAGVFDGKLSHETLKDKHGTVNIYLLPFVKPAMVSPYAGRTMESYDEAVREAIAASSVDEAQRNVLVAHQFVTAGGVQPERSESEAISIGGVDNVDASAFDSFDYVALGHLHGPQRIGRDTVRYAGSPLKYSFSEARQKKSLTIVELGGKGNVLMKQVRLNPLRDMRRIRGPIDELIQAGREAAERRNVQSGTEAVRVSLLGSGGSETAGPCQTAAHEKQVVSGAVPANEITELDGGQIGWLLPETETAPAEAETAPAATGNAPVETEIAPAEADKAAAGAENEDYISAVLTDEEEPYDALGRLRAVYPNLMYLEFERNGVVGADEAVETEENGADKKTPLELFADFYEAQNGEELNDRQLELLTSAAIAAAERTGGTGKNGNAEQIKTSAKVSDEGNTAQIKASAKVKDEGNAEGGDRG